MSPGPRPRVLFVNHSAVLGGGELSLLDIARHFRDTGTVVLLADGPFRERLAEAGVAVDVLASAAAVGRVARGGGLRQGLGALPGVLSVARSLVRHGRTADVFYANSQKAMVVAGLAGALARKPVIWHLRDLMDAEHFSAMNRRVATRMANSFASRVIANSEATRLALVGNGGRAEKIAVVHNGIGADRFGPTDDPADDREAAGLRAGLGLADAPVVGVFGRLARWKGQHVLLDALAGLPGVHGLVVGEALFDGDKAYARHLRDLVERMGLTRRVHFLGQRDDVPRLLRMCDAVAHTSIAPEPFGRVIVETMLAGRPVVATRAGGALEIVEDRHTGLLTPPGDAPALAAAIRSLLDDPAQARALARRGQAAARERFSLQAMLAGVERQIAAVVGTAAAR